MPDIIQLLPDNIANQIAAGEVIQRPASAVKELLENAVDAGATDIRLFILDAGKGLIQVVDNGQGMSETDARMAFERHATSKIRNIDDLFHIKTMGFRGEALASIAAVAQVELKTKRAEDEAGTMIEIENSCVTRQEPVAMQPGSSIAMKNLFFNVPARRNFLKSNPAETRHIIDEFTRVALSFPSIFFSLTSNGQEVMHLEKGSLKQRIVQVFGSAYNSKLVSVQENTDYLNVYGFVGKPETAKKTRGDQYFFVNNRFIRSAYLNHAVMSAFTEMIPRDSFPLYALFIDLDPVQVDVNVHPTKQEIKFDDEKIVYAFLQAAVRHALAQFSITPTLDFDLDPAIQRLDAVSKPLSEEKKAAVTNSSLYQTFTQKNQAHFIEPTNKSELRHWKDFFEAPGAGGAGASGGASGVAKGVPDGALGDDSGVVGGDAAGGVFGGALGGAAGGVFGGALGGAAGGLPGGAADGVLGDGSDVVGGDAAGGVFGGALGVAARGLPGGGADGALGDGSGVVGGDAAGGVFGGRGSEPGGALGGAAGGVFGGALGGAARGLPGGGADGVLGDGSGVVGGDTAGGVFGGRGSEPGGALGGAADGAFGGVLGGGASGGAGDGKGFVANHGSGRATAPLAGEWLGAAPNRIMPIENAPLQQLMATYIVTPTNRSFILVHQQAAHERILYEELKNAAAGHPIPSQKSLFPVTLTLSSPDAILLTELLPDLNVLGYTIEHFGKDSFIVQGTPGDLSQGNEKGVIESLLEQYKNFSSEIRFSKREKLVRSLARQQAIKPGTLLTDKEMRTLIDVLFTCAQHNVTPGGDPTYIEFKKDYVEKLFGR